MNTVIILHQNLLRSAFSYYGIYTITALNIFMNILNSYLHICTNTACYIN